MKLKEWHKILLLIIIIFIVVGFIFSRLFRSISVNVPQAAANSILELTISGEIPERSLEDPILEALGDSRRLSLQDILGILRKARRDEHISGILLRTGLADMGWAKTDEIRQALKELRSSGKPVYAYLEFAGTREYYLASAADSIFGPASGVLFINGFLSQPVFLKEMLDKIGVEADFVAHGEFKNAPDVFTRKQMSDAQREVINAILDDFYGRVVDTLAAARKISADSIRHFIDQGFFSIGRGYKHHLIDSLVYLADMKKNLRNRFGEDLQFLSAEGYLESSQRQIGLPAHQTFAVIFGVGTIVVGGKNQFGQDGLITSEGMAASIREAAEDDDIKAIILRIDSPGGSGTASDIIWREVVEARKKKPVIASVSDLAASGGYYIIMAADSIIAQSNSIVGSIGVFAGKFAWNGLYNKIGLNKQKILRGKNADIFSETQKFTPEQRQLLRNFIMEFYQEFVSKAAEGRHLTYEEIDRVARGRVWTGKQAIDIGLVDRLGDFDAAVRMARRMTGIPEEQPVRLRVYPRLKSYWQRLLQRSLSAQSAAALPELFRLPAGFRSTVNALPYLQAGEPLFLCMYQF